MRIYFAAPYTERDNLKKLVADLEWKGHRVTSRWINETTHDNGIDGVAEDQLLFQAKCAEEDLEDILNSEVLLFFSQPPRSKYSRGGRHFEMGYALAHGVSVVSIGYRENIFHALPEVHFVNTFAEAVELLPKIATLRLRDAG